MKKTNERKPWSIVIQPTRDGRGFQMDLVTLPSAAPAVRRLMDQLGDVLATAK